jgi:RNA polymerase sigma-70 factor
VSKAIDRFEAEVVAGAKGLLARAGESYSLEVQDLSRRVAGTIEKYLLADNRNPSALSVSNFIDELQADDLCLIVACERGVEAAWTDLMARFSTTVRSAARSASSNEAAAEDLAQSIWAELYGLRVREDNRPAGKLAYYSGRGSLAGWLRAVVAQLAVDHHRKDARLVPTEDDTELDRLAHSGDEAREQPEARSAYNPEELLSDRSQTVELEKALAQSLAELADEDRLLVKLYYFDGLRLREAGKVLGVHEATASRRLTRVHGELRDKVESILVKERGWTTAEAQKAFADVALNLETDIEPLIGFDRPSTERNAEVGKRKEFV